MRNESETAQSEGVPSDSGGMLRTTKTCTLNEKKERLSQKLNHREQLPHGWRKSLEERLQAAGIGYELDHAGQLVAMEKSLRTLLTAVGKLGLDPWANKPLSHLLLALDRLSNGLGDSTLTPASLAEGRPTDRSRGREYVKAAVVLASLLFRDSGLSAGGADERAASLARRFGISGQRGPLSKFTVRDWRLDSGRFGDSVHAKNLVALYLDLSRELLAVGQSRQSIAETMLRQVSALPGVVS